MPSQLQHELNKLRGTVSKTDKRYTDSVALLRDALTSAELAIKALESTNINYDSKINSIASLARSAYSSADASVKKTGDKLSGSLDMTGHSIIGTDELHAYSILGNTFYNWNGVVTLAISHAGNLTLAGNVDGRNVATDGTKLDTIATNATKYPDTGEQAFLDADHTKLNGIATNATKYPDTGEQAFLDADHTKLNGIDTGADVTADNPPQAHGHTLHTNRTRTIVLTAPFHNEGGTDSYAVLLDDAAIEMASWVFVIPKDFVSIGNVYIWYKMSGVGTAVLNIYGKYQGDNEATATHNNSSGNINLSPGNTNMHKYHAAGILTSAIIGDTGVIYVRRVANHGDDDAVGDFSIQAIEIEYVSDE